MKTVRRKIDPGYELEVLCDNGEHYVVRAPLLTDKSIYIQAFVKKDEYELMDEVTRPK